VNIFSWISLFWKPKPIREPVLYAAIGEVVTCESGHEICELSSDIYVGGPVESKIFINWRNQEPAQARDPFTTCTTCDKPYIRGIGGAQLHIDGEWRTTHGSK
jgi:hypothetical protein